MQIASLTGVQIVECERGKRAGQICRKRVGGGEVPSLSHPLPGRLNLLISQPNSYLQDNLIQVFRWWGRRQRSEQEKQQGGGVGGEREKEPLSLSLSFYIFVPLSYLSRTPLSERL